MSDAGAAIADRYRPDLIGLYVAATSVPRTWQIFVDPDLPQAWLEGDGRKIVDHLHGLGIDLIILVGDTRYMIPAEGTP